MPKTRNEVKDLDQVEHGWIALRALAWTMGGGIVALAILALDSPTVGDFARALSVSSLVAGAAGLLGALTGFVFGIPRTGQPGSGSSSPQAPRQAGEDMDETAARPPGSFRDNTNLEDISDWLTKILVGVGLTQLTTLPETLWKAAGKIAPGLGAGPQMQVIALSLALFFAATGFLFAYLWTRLYLKGALVQAGALSLVRQVTQKVSELEAQGSKDARALNLAALQLSPGTSTPEVNVDELKGAVAEASSAARTTIYYRAWEVRSANWRTDKAKMAKTIPVFAALADSDPEDRYHQNHGQLGWALKDSDPPDWVRAEQELTKAIEIRNRRGENGWLYYEASRAICRIHLMKEPRLSAAFSREDIEKDLRAVTQLSEQDNFTLREPIVLQWLQEQGLEPADLAGRQR